MVTLFKETVGIIEMVRQRVNEAQKPVKNVDERIKLAKECLDDAEDRWDYDSIKKDIESMEWAKKESAINKKLHGYTNQIFLSDTEVDLAIDSYNTDVAASKKHYDKLRTDTSKLMQKFSEEMGKALYEMDVIEYNFHRGEGIRIVIPQHKVAELKTFDITKSTKMARENLKRLEFDIR